MNHFPTQVKIATQSSRKTNSILQILFFTLILSIFLGSCKREGSETEDMSNSQAFFSAVQMPMLDLGLPSSLMEASTPYEQVNVTENSVALQKAYQEVGNSISICSYDSSRINLETADGASKHIASTSAYWLCFLNHFLRFYSSNRVIADGEIHQFRHGEGYRISLGESQKVEFFKKDQKTSPFYVMTWIGDHQEGEGRIVYDDIVQFRIDFLLEKNKKTYRVYVRSNSDKIVFKLTDQRAKEGILYAQGYVDMQLPRSLQFQTNSILNREGTGIAKLFWPKKSISSLQGDSKTAYFDQKGSVVNYLESSSDQSPSAQENFWGHYAPQIKFNDASTEEDLNWEQVFSTSFSL